MVSALRGIGKKRNLRLRAEIRWLRCARRGQNWQSRPQRQAALLFGALYNHNPMPLPLPIPDKNIKQADALFTDWPQAETVIGNPSFQSKNKMQEELGVPYLHKLRARHTVVPGHADYCVYWFRLAHDHLKDGQRAGLVGTNTIRQNYSREGGLLYRLRRRHNHGSGFKYAVVGRGQRARVDCELD